MAFGTFEYNMWMWMWMRVCQCVCVCPLLLKSFLYVSVYTQSFHQNEFPSNTISCSFHTQFHCHLVNLLCLCGSYTHTHMCILCWISALCLWTNFYIGIRKKTANFIECMNKNFNRTKAFQLCFIYICFAYFDWLSSLSSLRFI